MITRHKNHIKIEVGYMRRQNNEQGFSLLELMMTISIMGILAASITYGVADFVKEKRSEQHVMGLWSELSTLRARAIRDDRRYIVKFEKGTNDVLTYKVYRDEQDNHLLNPADLMSSGFMGASGDVTFGFATGSDVQKVDGYTAINGMTNPPTIAAGWKTSTIGAVTLQDCIIFFSLFSIRFFTFSYTFLLSSFSNLRLSVLNCS